MRKPSTRIKVPRKNDHNRGVWVQVATSQPFEKWWKVSTLASALLYAQGFYETPGVAIVQVLEWGVVRLKYTPETGETIMGILSNANKTAHGSFITATALAQSGVTFTILDIRQDEFKGQEQWVFDVATTNEERLPTGRVDRESGEDVLDHMLTFKMTKDSTRNAIVEALRDENALPYGPAWLRMSGSYIVFEDDMKSHPPVRPEGEKSPTPIERPRKGSLPLS